MADSTQRIYDKWIATPPVDLTDREIAMLSDMAQLIGMIRGLDWKVLR